MLPPSIDNRDWSQLLEQFRRLAPFYTPEWRFTPDDPDPGAALLMIAAEMLNENVKRLNQVPLNHLISYLNLFDVSLLSARPARTFLTFTPSDGAPAPVLLPAHIQIAAPGGEQDVIFELEQPLLVTPARPLHMVCTDGELDQIVHVTDRLHQISVAGEPFAFPIFPGRLDNNMQRHELYIGHPDVLNIVNPAFVQLEFSFDARRFTLQETVRQLAEAGTVEWSYYSDGSWRPFDEVSLDMYRIGLRKSALAEIGETEVNGVVSRWIRAAVAPGRMDRLGADGRLPEIDGIRMQSAFDGAPGEGFEPDQLFQDDIELTADGCYPFGEFFVPQSCFYVASREAFSKRRGLVTLELLLDRIPNRMSQPKPKDIDWKLIMKKSAFDEPEVPRAAVIKVQWEYWNGKSWVRLFAGAEYESLFFNPYENEKLSLIFHCPPDMEETMVNSHINYWIRARILKLDNLYALDPIYMSPWIERLRISYEYGDTQLTAEQCNTVNALAWHNRRGSIVSSTRASFRPFERLDNVKKTCYLGFDAPPVKGPISLFMALEQAGNPPRYRNVRAEYWREAAGRGEWAELKLNDGTESLTRSGTLQFVGPRDFAERGQFGITGWWIRLVLEGEPEGAPSPVVKGAFINTAPAVQQETVRNETPEGVNLAVLQFKLSRSPVRLEEIWIDETGLTDEQVRLLQQQLPEATEVIRDSEGLIQKVWVKWQAADALTAAAADDRYYTIDRNSGVISFGEAQSSRLPIPFEAEKIRAHYKQIRGAAGNVAERTATNLQSSFAFIDAVFNPVPATGGSDSETLEEALRRGPQIVRHRGRAVTAADYEWLAREASLQVAAARCLPNTNERLEKESGAVTIVIYPKDGHREPRIFSEVKRQVAEYLSTRTSNTLMQAGKIHIVPPAYIEVSISAELIVSTMEDILTIEQEAIARLDRFLHPLYGQYDGKGWSIGQPLHISSFYALLKAIPRVNHIARLTMDAVKIENSVRTEIPAANIGRYAHGMIIGGAHAIAVRI